MITKKYKPFVLSAGITLGIITGAFLGTKSCNNTSNTKTIITPEYSVQSYSIGLNGHVEYVTFKNGSHDIKIYPVWGNRIQSSEFFQDLNGDGFIDIIRKNDSEWNQYRLEELLVRKGDYKKNKERFDNVDELLQQLIQKYDTSKRP